MRTLYCLIGPSGSGKSTLEKNIKNEFDWLTSVESYTTRPPRYENEKGHRFISKEEFDKLKLIAYTYFDGAEYGVTEELLDEADIYVIDFDGLKVLKQKYQRPLIAVGLIASEETCKERMKERVDSEEKINQRILNDREKFTDHDFIKYCDVLIDANLNEKEVLAQFIDKVATFENKLPVM